MANSKHPLHFLKPGFSFKDSNSPKFRYQNGGSNMTRVSEASSSQIGNNYNYNNKDYTYNTDNQGNQFTMYRDQNPDRYLEYAADNPEFIEKNVLFNEEIDM